MDRSPPGDRGEEADGVNVQQRSGAESSSEQRQVCRRRRVCSHESSRYSKHTGSGIGGITEGMIALKIKYDFMRNSRCSGRRWRGWCASATKALSSSHVLKPLVPALCISVVVTYGLADRLRNFVSGIFIPQYHYPYAVALCFGQALVSLLFLNLLHLLYLAPLKPYSRPLGERLLVPAVCSSIHGVLAMWAKASSSSTGLYPIIQPLLPLVTVGFSLCLKLASPPSIHLSVWFSILSLTSFVITVAQGLAGVDTLEYMYAPLALLLHSISLTWLAKVSEAECRQPADAQASIFDIYYTQLVNQSWVLGLLWLLHPDSPWKVLSHSSWRTLLFHGYLLAILLLGMVLNFFVGVSALCVSPLAAAVLHSARQVVQPFLHLL